MKLTIISLLIIFSTTALHCAEADNFTNRDKEFADMSGPINFRANLYIKLAVGLSQDENCEAKESEANLYKRLRVYFANHRDGELVKWILHTDQLTKDVIPVKDSVYGEWSKRNGFLLGRDKAQSSSVALAPMITMGNQYMGTDKFEHIFGMGFRYFDRYHLKKKSLLKILKYGVIKEKTFLGGNILATGVFAYADLAANFNGMRFWNHMLLKDDDVLGKEYNQGPYIKCENKKWVVNSNQKLKLETYMDASMDESINCSDFASRGGLRKFEASLARLQKKSSDKISCPMSLEKNKEMYNKYDRPLGNDVHMRSVADFLINRGANGLVEYFSRFSL